jgi:hypothetical protein
MKPPEVAQIHREICEREECRYRKKLNYDDPCAACPNGHWGRYEIAACDDPKRKVPRKRGDRIAAIAQPIARVIDKITGGKTHVSTCGGCKQMQKDLNAGMSFGKALRKRLRRN